MNPKSLFMNSAFGEVSQVKQIVSVNSGWVRESTRGRTMSVYQLSCSFHYRISQLVFPNSWIHFQQHWDTAKTAALGTYKCLFPSCEH